MSTFFRFHGNDSSRERGFEIQEIRLKEYMPFQNGNAVFLVNRSRKQAGEAYP
jgi:hypothetical protein